MIAWPETLTFATIAATAAMVGLVIHFAFVDDTERKPNRADASRAALQWIGTGSAEPVRRDGNGWEVDVRRPNGSVIEVALSANLRLRGFDEERAPDGRPAHDEITGHLRDRAIRAARRHAPEGVVRGVERERDGSIEVDIVRADRTVAEIELDQRLRITDTDEEQIGDE